MHEEHLGRVAGRGVLRLAVDRQGRGHRGLGVLVEVEVADAVGVAEDGDAALGLDARDEFLGTAGHDEVDELVEGEELGHLFPRLEGGQPTLRQAGREARGVDDAGQGGVGARRLAPALEDDGVAALGGEGGHLHEGVGPRLEDHGHETDRAAHLPEREAVVEEAR